MSSGRSTAKENAGTNAGVITIKKIDYNVTLLYAVDKT